jgi:hypothetical protein
MGFHLFSPVAARAAIDPARQDGLREFPYILRRVERNSSGYKGECAMQQRLPEIDAD